MERIAFLPIAPEIALFVGAIFVLLADITLGLGRKVWAGIAGASLLVATAFSVLQWRRVDAILDIPVQNDLLTFSARGIETPRLPMVVMDHYSALAGIVLFTVGAIALLGASRLISSLERRAPEFVVLFLLAVAGLHTMTMASNLILLFIGLETASISLYVIAGFTRGQERSDEAAIKYFLLGSFASAIFLYGVALTFAATGSTSLYGSFGINAFFASNTLASSGIALAGLAMMMVGLGFKVSAAPFHQWAPDVYQGAPSGAVPMMAAGVKIAGFAAIGRILNVGFPALADDWMPAVAVIAIVSVLFGTLGAIGQDDLKRMLAFSGVAHAGFIFTGVVAGVDGLPAMWFYVATYAFQLVGAFTIIAVVSGFRSDRASFDRFSGLASRSPFLAAMLALFMLAMGGIPLTAGFVGKVAVFTAAADAGYLWLAVAALVVAVAGLYFYLRVIVLMYFQEPALAEAPGTATAPPELSSSTRSVVAVCATVTLLFGIVPWPLLNFVGYALPL